MMILAMLLVVHGLIHLLGFAKAFGLAELPQLTQLILPFSGLLWLIASSLFVAAAVSLFVWPRGWWAIGSPVLTPVRFVTWTVDAWAPLDGRVLNGGATIGPNVKTAVVTRG